MTQCTLYNSYKLYISDLLLLIFYLILFIAIIISRLICVSLSTRHAAPSVAFEGNASNMEGSCENIE